MDRLITNEKQKTTTTNTYGRCGSIAYSSSTTHIIFWYSSASYN